MYISDSFRYFVSDTVIKPESQINYADLVDISLESCHFSNYVKLPYYSEILITSQEKLHVLVVADWLSAVLAAECTQRCSLRWSTASLEEMGHHVFCGHLSPQRAGFTAPSTVASLLTLLILRVCWGEQTLIMKPNQQRLTLVFWAFPLSLHVLWLHGFVYVTRQSGHLQTGDDVNVDDYIFMWHWDKIWPSI